MRGNEPVPSLLLLALGCGGEGQPAPPPPASVEAQAPADPETDQPPLATEPTTPEPPETTGRYLCDAEGRCVPRPDLWVVSESSKLPEPFPLQEMPFRMVLREPGPDPLVPGLPKQYVASGPIGPGPMEFVWRGAPGELKIFCSKGQQGPFAFVGVELGDDSVQRFEAAFTLAPGLDLPEFDSVPYRAFINIVLPIGTEINITGDVTAEGLWLWIRGGCGPTRISMRGEVVLSIVGWTAPLDVEVPDAAVGAWLYPGTPPGPIRLRAGKGALLSIPAEWTVVPPGVRALCATDETCQQVREVDIDAPVSALRWVPWVEVAADGEESVTTRREQAKLLGRIMNGIEPRCIDVLAPDCGWTSRRRPRGHDARDD